MAPPMLLAVAVGLGAVLVAAGLRRRQPPTGDQGFGGMRTRTARRVGSELMRQRALLQDAVMVGRSIESHALAKLGGLVVGVGLVALMAFFAVAVGLELPLAVVAMAAALAALAGWWLPDSMLKSAAEAERERFKQSSEAWLELVAQLVTAGHSTHAALAAAATVSEQAAFVIIRDAIAEATALGESPWSGLRRMVDDRRLPFMEPFVSALELAGTTGAGARRSVLAQVEAARAKSLSEADAKAASASESMGAPLALIGGAFMMLMGYPPLAGIMNSDVASNF